MCGGGGDWREQENDGIVRIKEMLFSNIIINLSLWSVSFTWSTVTLCSAAIIITIIIVVEVITKSTTKLFLIENSRGGS